ncbi:MAG: alanine racemase [Chloroflexi bacterium]|nr:alanine racemase [Chloroflexota bacterium]
MSLITVTSEDPTFPKENLIDGDYSAPFRFNSLAGGTIEIDFLVYLRIIPEFADRAVLVVEDYLSAVEGLATTTLRAVVGEMNLDPQSEQVAQRLIAALQTMRDQTVPKDVTGDVLESHLRQMIARCLAHGAQPVLMTYPELDPFSVVLKLGRETDVELVDMRLPFQAAARTQNREQLFVPDGHCADGGYVNTGRNLCGVEPGQPALELAKAVAGSEGLTFAGLMSIERADLDGDKQAERSKQSIQRLLDTRELLESNGLSVDIVSIGGTHDYEIAGATAGVTEVPAGAYALMDARHGPHRPQLTPAARVMATVTSRPEPGVVILDSGKKAIGDDTGMPLAEALPDHTVAALSAEHGRLMVEDGDSDLKLGDKVWLTPWDLGGSANVYDFMQGVRNGRLEAVLDISARGRYR